jgi:hypothetical protein
VFYNFANVLAVTVEDDPVGLSKAVKRKSKPTVPIYSMNHSYYSHPANYKRGPLFVLVQYLLFYSDVRFLG